MVDRSEEWRTLELEVGEQSQREEEGEEKLITETLEKLGSKLSSIPSISSAFH